MITSLKGIDYPMTCNYRIFGLNIASRLPLPSPALPNLQPDDADVVITYGSTPASLAAPVINGVRYQAAPDEFLLKVDKVASFYVHSGSRITIMPENGAGEDDILVFLMGSAFGALLHQRNILVLHGSAIAVNGQSIAFCGPSGIGKSTLAAALQQRNYPFLADDLCAISISTGRPVIIPGFPRLKLWADTLKKLDKCCDKLKSVRWAGELEKYFLPVDSYQHAPLPLQAVFILESSNKDTLAVTQLPGNEKIDPLIEHTYRRRFLHGLGGKKDHFKQCAAVAANVDVHRVVRPDKGFRLNELVDLLAEHFPL
ncbi:MAG: hypothetical protein FIA91_05165 [Geobacter sp.]|nr:hypothetical protein [Geobacter sp.]